MVRVSGIPKDARNGIFVVNETSDIDLYDLSCEKCRSPKVYARRLPARWRDGEETYIYNCPSCKHSWREGGED